MGRRTSDRGELLQRFDAAIDDLEEAIRRCHSGRWSSSVWRVLRTDPWVWPAPGVEPVAERTEESIQQFSAFWCVAYHCLWFLDFYAGTDPDGFESPEYVSGGPEEMPWPADGAAPLPGRAFGRDVLLRYAVHGRARVHESVAQASDAAFDGERCPADHPHAGKTLAQLLDVNLRHVQEHGQQLLAFATSA